MIERMDHLNIVVTDLDAARNFFSLFGFTEGISSHLDTSFLASLTGISGARGKFVALHHAGSNLSIELLQFDGGSKPAAGIGLADRIGFRHLAFAVTDLESEVARLKEHGVSFLSDIRVWEKTGKKLIYLYGPDGILLELAEYPRP
ncbi:VOC family protein [Geomonas sp. Red32]|uniref:VOC family protein n=1 Tax=Geomonas sp. Red32 TaxID=2912856 RepID=UPI00202CB31B|nr:VOC family protein [Geomonas sp. Red32]MCM0081686.1 VOC family protein [Geomonas sp. Red32]